MSDGSNIFPITVVSRAFPVRALPRAAEAPHTLAHQQRQSGGNRRFALLE
jgi:hypothetical protein